MYMCLECTCIYNHDIIHKCTLYVHVCSGFVNHLILISQDLLYIAQPSEFVGVLSALTGEPSFISVKAASYCHLIAITKANLYL